MTVEPKMGWPITLDCDLGAVLPENRDVNDALLVFVLQPSIWRNRLHSLEDLIVKATDCCLLQHKTTTPFYTYRCS